MQKEDDVDERDDDRLLDQRPPERVDRAVDERRAVVKRDDLDARRQARLERLNLFLHAVDHVHGADAVARHDDTPDRLFGALHEGRRTERITDLHGGDLPDEDRHAALGGDNHILQVARALDQPETAYHGPRPTGLDDVAANVAVAAHDGIDDGRERDLVGAQAVGIHVDLVLPDEPADAGDLRHAGDRVELIPDEPVLDGAQVAHGVALPLNGGPAHVADAGPIGTP